jgi:glutamine phosphoribosylpyrophosphate amidotransferase
MCGITGYIGYRDAYPIIINGLQRLEYRGYDSAGLVLFDNNQVNLSKTKGKVSDLVERANTEISKEGKLGIGHTRWATHGVPNDDNSHPHTSQSGDLVIVHNGIIENYDTIKKELATRVSILYYEEKFSQNEVASKLGISRSYVSQLLTYARLNNIVKIVVNVEPLYPHSIRKE